MALPSLAATACGKGSQPPRETPVEELENALGPQAMIKALKRAGGGHYRATFTMEFAPPGAAGQAAGAKDTVSTTTDLTVDKTGNYRLLETNDRDGGREVISHGKDLAVGLRYGRLIRRPQQEPESGRYIDEALGGPYAAWEVARRFAEVTRKDENGGVTLDVTKAAEPQSVRGDLETGSPLQKWRESINVEELNGQVRLDGAQLIPTRVRLEVRFGLRRDEVPLAGLVRIDAEVKQLGATRVDPPQAEELPARQRTILEERALLGRTGSGEPATR